MNHVASGSSYLSFLFFPTINRLFKFPYFFRKIIIMIIVIGFKCTEGADASVFIAVGG